VGCDVLLLLVYARGCANQILFRQAFCQPSFAWGGDDVGDHVFVAVISVGVWARWFGAGLLAGCSQLGNLVIPVDVSDVGVDLSAH